MNHEFYIGYEPDMPPRLAQRARRITRGLLAIALLIPGVLVLTEDRFASGVFEFGQVRTFNGQIVEFPYPALIKADADGATRAYWLVNQGKHGAQDLVRGRDGQHVRLAGALIQRDGDVMIEIAPGGIDVTAAKSAYAIGPLRSGANVVLEGEIVDSKCHLGVMKPGEGPTHRDCAVRCLLGRIPPMFVARDLPGLERVSLVSAAGGPLLNSDTWAGRRVSIRGEILQRGVQTFLAVAPHDIRFLD